MGERLGYKRGYSPPRMSSLSRRIRQHAGLRDKVGKMLNWRMRGRFQRGYRRGRRQHRNKRIWSLGRVWRIGKDFGRTACARCHRSRIWSTHCVGTSYDPVVVETVDTSAYAPMPSHRPWCISYSKDIQRAGLSPVSSHLTRSHLGIWMSTRSERPDLQEQRNGPWDSRVIASGSGV